MRLLLALLTVTLMTGCATSQEIQLAHDGEALLPVVVAADADASVRASAAELADYLGRIAGATFAVGEGDGSRGIVVGTAGQFLGTDFPEALAIRDTYDGKEAYVIRSEGERLLLIGATERGTSHAVYRLLDELGCRWFFPNAAWEVIPSIPDLRVNLDLASRPALLARRIWYGYGFFDRGQKRTIEEYRAWERRNRMGESMQAYTGHAWQGIILQHKKVFAEHPEYLALVKGERKGDQLCVSNPGLRQLVVQHALDYFAKRPGADMVSLDPADGYGQCECAECAKLGTISDRVFGLANEAAKAVAREYPGKLVGLLAYSEHSEPPAFQLEPNVYIQLTRGFIRGRYSFDELMELWPKHCTKMGYYDYYSVYLWDWDMPPGGRGANTSYIAESIPDYAAHGATSLSAESGCNWGLHGRGYYLASRLMWDPAADPQAILDDFHAKAFGPAAAAVARYYDRLDPGNEPLMSEHLLAMALRDLEEATALAADLPEVLARLAQLKQYQHYVRLRWDFNHTDDQARKKELALAILTHVYRHRYTYMNHWEALRQNQTRTWAKTFEEPTWAFNEPSPNKPWMVDDEPTMAETEANFRDDLARFQPQAVVERTFSANLVPAGLDGEAPAATGQHYQSPPRYYLYSTGGEALDFSLVTGTIAWYRDRRDTTWTVYAGTGETVVAEGRLPLDGEEHPVNVAVPAAGQYRLEIADAAAGTRVIVPSGRPAVLALQRGRKYNHSGHMQRLWFWVPKGTEAVHYFVVNSSPHRLFGPDGKLLREVDASGTFVTVPVPEGMDGGAWSMDRLALGQLWFFNCPPYLAASPQALLIPTELTE